MAGATPTALWSRTAAWGTCGVPAVLPRAHLMPLLGGCRPPHETMCRMRGAPCARIAQWEPIVFCRIFTVHSRINCISGFHRMGCPSHFSRGKSCATNSLFIRYVIRRAPCGKRPFYEQARSIVARVAYASIEYKNLRPSGCVLAFRCNERKLLMPDHYSNSGAPMPPRRGSHAKPQDSDSRVPESVRSFITQ